MIRLLGITSVADGLIAHWSPTVSGGTGNDLVGNRDWTLFGGAVIEAETGAGGSYALKTTHETNMGADFTRINYSGAFTLALWIRWDADDPSNFSRMIGSIDPFNSSSWIRLRENDHGTIEFNFWGHQLAGRNNPRSWPVDEWFHLVMTSSDAYSTNIYKDGTHWSGPHDHNRTRDTWFDRLGTYATSAGFPGDFDSVRFYDRVLDPAEIQELASAGRAEDGLTPVPGDPPQNVTPPIITGELEVGEIVSSSDGTWDNNPTDFAYQWFSGSTSGGANPILIPGATSNTYQLTENEQTRYVACQVTATNTAGSTPAISAWEGPVTGPVIWPGTGNSDGTSIAIAAGSAIVPAAGSSDGTSTAVAFIAADKGAGTSLGSATVTGQALARVTGAGLSDGVAVVLGASNTIFAGVGFSAGIATVDGVAGVSVGTGLSIGYATVIGRSIATSAGFVKIKDGELSSAKSTASLRS